LGDHRVRSARNPPCGWFNFKRASEISHLDLVAINQCMELME
jgi:hypothetical protein